MTARIDRAVDRDELTLTELAAEVHAMTADWPEGPALAEADAALVDFAVRSGATALDLAGTRRAVARALDCGVRPEQLGEAMVLVSGIGMHGLIGSSGVVAEVLRERDHPAFAAALTDEQRSVWDAAVPDDPRESRIAQVAPHFLPLVLRLAPDLLGPVVDFRAAPWRGTAITALQRELIGIAVDATASHRFLPTLRLHVHRAGELGAGSRMIRETLALAAEVPAHRGVR
jgi:alkylhydroperoxidase/carboxymuconolactone decarboxylase family protein YurZ